MTEADNTQGPYNHTALQSFPIASDRPDMSGKTEVGQAKYPTTSSSKSFKFTGPTVQ